MRHPPPAILIHGPVSTRNCRRRHPLRGYGTHSVTESQPNSIAEVQELEKQAKRPGRQGDLRVETSGGCRIWSEGRTPCAQQRAPRITSERDRRAVSGTVSCLLCGADENYFVNDPIDGCAAESVGVFRHPVLAAFGKKIKKIPDRRKQIDSSMMSLSERCLGGIEMVDFPVGGTAENADAGSL